MGSKLDGIVIKEIVVGSGKQLKFGNNKAHVSMTITTEGMDSESIEQAAVCALGVCDDLVRAGLEQQIDKDGTGKPAANGKAKEHPVKLEDDEINF